MKVMCPRAECSYVWDYNGKRIIVGCPRCHSTTTVKRGEQRVREKDIGVKANE